MDQKLQLLLTNARKASKNIIVYSSETINKVLHKIADAAIRETPYILKENEKDLARMSPEDPKYDRLKLTADRIAGIASDMKNVASLPSPLGHILQETQRPNGLLIRKVSVPFGVIGIIYEARPNVTFDVFSLCLKSGNACVLKGGSDAEYSNESIAKIIRNVLSEEGLDPNLITLLPSDRQTTAELLNARDYVDLLIPRGSQALINFVRENAKIPVIETGAGICHTYFDASGDATIGQAIITNAKTRRVSVCNALDCLIIHQDRIADLPFLCEKMQEHQVEIFADEKAYVALEGHYPNELLRHATEEHFGTEFLSYKMAIRTVSSFEEALEHIDQYSSHHSEAIIATDDAKVQKFLSVIDAAAVYANTSTAFTDGAQFGLGAEIGISTQKLHARGPMGLEELTSYKWIVTGNGQIRPS
ncbi:MAG: glutamate-5-semialdehyde dehydrogenase [Bacteroidota bacterium]|nr:glutamate-5-semialdehyde dehydrogenase [Bacteroidota bacterium]